MYANVCMCVYPSQSVHVQYPGELVSWPLGKREAGFPQSGRLSWEIVQEEMGGSRFHWAFYGSLATNPTTAEGSFACCLTFNTHEEDTSGWCAPTGKKRRSERLC